MKLLLKLKKRKQNKLIDKISKIRGFSLSMYKTWNIRDLKKEIKLRLKLRKQGAYYES